MNRFFFRPIRRAALVALAGIVVSVGATPARADEFANPSVLVVTTTNDGLVQDGKCSVREALINANANNQSGSSDCPAGMPDLQDTIRLEGGKVYSLNYVGEDDTAQLGDLDIVNNAAELDLVIESTSNTRAVIKAAFDQNNPDRVLEIAPGAAATLKRITITGGVSSEAGGGIFNEGTLKLEGAWLLKNQSHGGALGGGIYNAPGSWLETSGKTMFSENLSMSAGGALANFGGSVELGETTLQENTALENGGAIANVRVGEKPGILYLNNSTTLVKNTAAGSDAVGGAIWNGAGGYLDIRNVTLRENRAVQQGGAIFNHETADALIMDSTLADNVVGFNGKNFARGGGLYNEGRITLNGVLVRGNSTGSGASTSGGGIWNKGNATIHHSAIVENRTHATGGYTGGGIANAGKAFIWNSTLSGNWASGTGSALFSVEGETVLAFTTIANNVANSAFGGALAIDGDAKLAMRASIIGGNKAENVVRDCVINVNKAISHGYNIIGTACEGFSDGVNNDRVGVNPQLEALAPMGTTFAHQLNANSPARDYIPLAQCSLALDGEGMINSDQRGEHRPQHAGCDVGAVERAAQRVLVPMAGK